MYKKKALEQTFKGFLGAPAENRTPDTMIKSHVLYRLSYRGKYKLYAIVYSLNIIP